MKIPETSDGNQGVCIPHRKSKRSRRKEAPDWLGCGRVITQESWDGFLAAQHAYWMKKDAEAQTEKV